MRANMTPDQALAEMQRLRSLAEEQRATWQAYKKEHDLAGYQTTPQSSKLEHEYLDTIAIMQRIRESGAIPWIEVHGVGNRILESGVVWARTAFDTHVRDYPTDFQGRGDGRVIELFARYNNAQYTIAFTTKEQVSDLIQQLTEELARWDEFSPGDEIDI